VTTEEGGPSVRRTGPHPDPLAMSPGEKVAAGWEARHDVAARGHRADPGAVQHYLAGTRTREVQRSGSTPSTVAPEPVAVPGPPPAGSAAGLSEPTPSSRRRRWWPFGGRGR
jgi:hypothetical protein